MKPGNRWIPLLLLYLAATAGPVQAQQLGMLSGQVLDAESDLPLAGVSVLLGTLDQDVVGGTSTDADGRYRFLNIAQGRFVLLVRRVGYEEYRSDISIRDTPVVRNVKLKTSLVEMNEVEVVDERGQTAADVRTSISRLDPQSVTALPGANENVLQALQTLPGVVAASDYSSQLIVRGGGPDQNLVLLDDIEVFNPFQLNGFTSIFNPSIVRGISLYTGAFPAAYGDRLSSVLEVDTRDGNSQKWITGGLSANTLRASVVLEGKTGFWNGSWIASGRRTFFDLFTDTFIRDFGTFNDIAFPRFTDVQGKLVLRPATGHRVQVTGLYASDVLDLVVGPDVSQQAPEDRLASDDLSTTAAVGASWLYVPSALFSTKVFANWYRNAGDSGFIGSLVPSDELVRSQREIIDIGEQDPIFGSGSVNIQYDQAYAFRKLTVGTVTSWQRDRHTFEVGAGWDRLSNRLELDLRLNAFGQLVFDALQSAPNWFGALADSVDLDTFHDRWHVYAQDRLELLEDRLFLQPGVRYDYYDITSRAFLSPRVGLSYSLNPITTLRASWGLYRQSPGYEKLLGDGNVFELTRFEQLDNLSAERATHYVLGLNRWLNDEWIAKVEAYWKEYDDLIVQSSVVEDRLYARYKGVGSRAESENYDVETRSVASLTAIPINNAEGRVYGLELMLEKRWMERSDAWSGWLSYALSNATREQEVRGERIRFPFQYDRRHVLNLVVNYRFDSRWQAGVTWRYGSGFPYTPAIGFEPLVGTVLNPDTGEIAVDPATGEVIHQFYTDDNGYMQFVPVYGDADNFNAARLPDYHRLDLRITYRPREFRVPWEFYVDIINLYSRKNVFRYRSYAEIEIDTRTGIPESQRLPPRPGFFTEPIYMLPFLPSFGFSVTF